MHMSFCIQQVLVSVLVCDADRGASAAAASPNAMVQRQTPAEQATIPIGNPPPAARSGMEASVVQAAPMNETVPALRGGGGEDDRGAAPIRPGRQRKRPVHFNDYEGRRRRREMVVISDSQTAAAVECDAVACLDRCFCKAARPCNKK